MQCTARTISRSHSKSFTRWRTPDFNGKLRWELQREIQWSPGNPKITQAERFQGISFWEKSMKDIKLCKFKKVARSTLLSVRKERFFYGRESSKISSVWPLETIFYCILGSNASVAKNQQTCPLRCCEKASGESRGSHCVKRQLLWQYNTEGLQWTFEPRLHRSRLDMHSLPSAKQSWTYNFFSPSAFLATFIERLCYFLRKKLGTSRPDRRG